jgi:bromodomain-containing protein 8
VEDSIMETETDDVKPLALQEGYSATIIDTDDDSPIEVIKEDKIGKTKRDYSRKKPEVVVTDTSKATDEQHHTTPHKHHRHTDDDGGSSKSVGFNTRMKAKEQRDGSESPMVDDDQSSDNAPPRTRRRHSSTPIIESIPSSPASSDDREYRLWKKSILMVYNRLSTHKFASAFLRVNTDENYKNIILRPMDLHTIKKNIENGSIRSTSDFFSNIMLMCQNALMYYKKDNSIYGMAKELMAESITLMETTPETVKAKESGGEKVATPSMSSATMASGSGSNSQSSSVTSATGSSISSPVIKRAGRKSQRLPQN